MCTDPYYPIIEGERVSDNVLTMAYTAYHRYDDMGRPLDRKEIVEMLLLRFKMSTRERSWTGIFDTLANSDHEFTKRYEESASKNLMYWRAEVEHAWKAYYAESQDARDRSTFLKGT